MVGEIACEARRFTWFDRIWRIIRIGIVMEIVQIGIDGIVIIVIAIGVVAWLTIVMHRKHVCGIIVGSRRVHR